MKKSRSIDKEVFAFEVRNQFSLHTDMFICKDDVKTRRRSEFYGLVFAVIDD